MKMNDLCQMCAAQDVRMSSVCWFVVCLRGQLQECLCYSLWLQQCFICPFTHNEWKQTKYSPLFVSRICPHPLIHLGLFHSIRLFPGSDINYLESRLSQCAIFRKNINP